MNKLFYVAVFAAIIISGCNNATKNADKEKSATTKKSKGGVQDSYTVDTLYQALPDMLLDISASENFTELLAQNWIHADDKEELKYADQGNLEIPVRSLSMSADFTVLKNCRNTMEEGNWKFDADKKTITFTYKGSSKDIYKLRALAADELKLTNVGIGSETILTFLSDGRQHKLTETDPFHISNNHWRIKPKSSESDEAIKQRLKDNLHFFILYYKDAIARREVVFSFYGLPSCINWYAGGIYLQKKKELTDKWKDCFYNEAQAMKAYNMMDKIISKKYTWPKGDANWIKKNLFVLEQMYQSL
jgi:hypothetical protein